MRMCWTFWACPLSSTSRGSWKCIQLDCFHSVNAHVVKCVQIATSTLRLLT